MKHGLELRTELARSLRELFVEQSWTQAQAARALNTSQPQISKVNRLVVKGISAEQLVEWLAVLGRGVRVQVGQLEESRALDRRYILLENGRKALDDGSPMQAKLYAQALWWEYPKFRPGGALMYDVLMALGWTIDAAGWAHFKDDGGDECVSELIQDHV